MDEIKGSILKQVFKKRNNWSYKYDYGSLLVIGGSKLYHGSPALAALAALRSGTDLVTVVAPERAADIVAGLSPDLITYPLKGDYLEKRHLPALLEASKDKTAIVIGNGLCRQKKTLLAVKEFLKITNKPAVIDADAIHALDKDLLKSNFLITPHTREFFAISRIELQRSLESRLAALKNFACSSTILLKGHVDIIFNASKTAINTTGNYYMTKGGTGDTLAGICGSLLAQGIDYFDAACAAAYINGKAGDLAARQKKQGLLATDLIEKIPDVIR